jgi:hypothetical protein
MANQKQRRPKIAIAQTGRHARKRAEKKAEHDILSGFTPLA